MTGKITGEERKPLEGMWVLGDGIELPSWPSLISCMRAEKIGLM